MLKKVHLKRNVLDRFALCGVLPGNSFVLMAAMPRDSVETVCQTCMRVASANFEQGTLAIPHSSAQDLVHHNELRSQIRKS